MQDVYSDPDDETAENNQEVKLKEKLSTINKQWWSMKKELVLQNERRHVSVELKITQLKNGLLISEIESLEPLIRTEEWTLEKLCKLLEFHKNRHQDELNDMGIRSADAVRRIEQAENTQLEQDALIEKLTDEKQSLEREIDSFEVVWSHLTHCKDILFKMSPVEWQEAQTAKDLSVHLNTGSDAKEPSPCTVTTSANVTNGGHNTLNRNDAEEDKPLLYFSEPEEFLEVMADFTRRNLFLTQNSAKFDEALKELNQSIEIETKKMQEDEDKVTLQIRDMQDRVDRKKARATKFKHWVLLHESLEATDEDIMLEALAVKVSEVYQRCIDKCLTNLSTLEMLTNIELRLCTLLEQLEGIPKDFVEAAMRIKEREKRRRKQQEKLRLEREKQKEMLKKCMQRSFSDSKKKMGRKLMPRFFPVESTPKEESKSSDEEDLEDFLFGTEDNQ